MRKLIMRVLSTQRKLLVLQNLSIYKGNMKIMCKLYYHAYFYNSITLYIYVKKSFLIPNFNLII